MKKLVKGLLIFLCVFTVLAVLITYVSIKNTKEEFNLVVQNEKGIDLYGTYDQNDLIINELVEDYNGVEIKIPKIDGLKNSKVQDKVN